MKENMTFQELKMKSVWKKLVRKLPDVYAATISAAVH
jgi:hypothetical protein